MRLKTMAMASLFLLSGCAADRLPLSEEQRKNELHSSVESFSSLFEEDILDSSTQDWTLITHAHLEPYSAYYNHRTVQTKDNIKTVLWLDLFYPSGLSPINIQSVYEFDCNHRDTYFLTQSRTDWVHIAVEEPIPRGLTDKELVIAAPSREEEYLEHWVDEHKTNRGRLEVQVWSELCEKREGDSKMNFSQGISQKTKRLESLSNQNPRK